MPQNKRVEAFFKRWVCQEAYIKAKGTGWLRHEHIPFAFEGAWNEEKGFSYYYEPVPEYAGALHIDRPLRIAHYVCS
ncbi:hypothetical protein [Candidatus Odyssella acanthamoebae]|uniref:hypothetical protein n=1 Tax=Candidatus Odyssella acanthamoebae TaxID=91604 RepID=UPI0006921925|nr:hypothetical protein [Candidatus Paracaedibacter acanthamoebae]